MKMYERPTKSNGLYMVTRRDTYMLFLVWNYLIKKINKTYYYYLKAFNFSSMYKMYVNVYV